VVQQILPVAPKDAKKDTIITSFYWSSQQQRVLFSHLSKYIFNFELGATA